MAIKHYGHFKSTKIQEFGRHYFVETKLNNLALQLTHEK